MRIIEDFRRKLSLYQVEITNLLGVIADAENRISELKREVKKLYEQNDEILDMNSIERCKK